MLPTFPAEQLLTPSASPRGSAPVKERWRARSYTVLRDLVARVPENACTVRCYRLKAIRSGKKGKGGEGEGNYFSSLKIVIFKNGVSNSFPDNHESSITPIDKTSAAVLKCPLRPVRKP